METGLLMKGMYDQTLKVEDLSCSIKCSIKLNKKCNICLQPSVGIDYGWAFWMKNIQQLSMLAISKREKNEKKIRNMAP